MTGQEDGLYGVEQRRRASAVLQELGGRKDDPFPLKRRVGMMPRAGRDDMFQAVGSVL